MCDGKTTQSRTAAFGTRDLARWMPGFLLMEWWLWSWVAWAWWPTWHLLVAGAFVAIASGLGAARCWNRCRFALSVAVLLSPPVLWPTSIVATTTAAYLTGDGYIACGGLPGSTDLPPSEPTTGIPYRAVHGCLTTDFIEFEKTVNNATIRALVRRFGPMRGHAPAKYDAAARSQRRGGRVPNASND